MEDRWLVEKQQKQPLKVKQSRQLGFTWALSGKNRHNAFQTNGRASRVRFRLDFRMYLFLAPN